MENIYPLNITFALLATAIGLLFNVNKVNLFWENFYSIRQVEWRKIYYIYVKFLEQNRVNTLLAILFCSNSKIETDLLKHCKTSSKFINSNCVYIFFKKNWIKCLPIYTHKVIILKLIFIRQDFQYFYRMMNGFTSNSLLFFITASISRYNLVVVLQTGF